MNKVETLNISLIGVGMEHGKCGSRFGVDLVEAMGITYFRSMPVNFGDNVMLFNCRNVPDVLPDWLTRSERTAQDFVGRSAMTQIHADAIAEDADRGGVFICESPYLCAVRNEVPRSEMWNESRTHPRHGGNGVGYVWPTANGNLIRVIDNEFIVGVRPPVRFQRDHATALVDGAAALLAFVLIALALGGSVLALAIKRGWML